MNNIDSIGSSAKIEQYRDESMYLQVSTKRGLSENITDALHIEVRHNNNKNRRKFIGIRGGHDGGRRVTTFSFRIREEDEISAALTLWKQIAAQAIQEVDNDTRKAEEKSRRMKSTLNNYANALEQVIGRKDDHER